jgi:hypothetical protein
MLNPPVSFPTLFWNASFYKFILLNFSSFGSFNKFPRYTWQVLKHVFMTPGCLSSVYNNLTVFNPCLTNSIPWGPEGFVSTTAAGPSPPNFLPNLSSLSRLSYSNICCFALRNSILSLFCCSRAILCYYSSIFLLASVSSLAILTRFLSCSSASLFSSAALFFLIASCSSFAFYIFSSFVSVLYYLDGPSSFL